MWAATSQQTHHLSSRWLRDMLTPTTCWPMSSSGAWMNGKQSSCWLQFGCPSGFVSTHMGFLCPRWMLAPQQRQTKGVKFSCPRVCPVQLFGLISPQMTPKLSLSVGIEFTSFQDFAAYFRASVRWSARPPPHTPPCFSYSTSALLSCQTWWCG